MKKLFILSAFIAVPFFVSAATYLNKTSVPMTISTTSACNDEEIIQFQDSQYAQEIISDESTIRYICSELEPCMKNESKQLLPHQSIELKNEQGQPVTIISTSLKEKREFFPTNDAFNYDITISKYPSRFSKITINSAR